MKVTKQQLEDARIAHELYWKSYLSGDIKTISALLDEEYTQVGSVENEVFFNKKDAVQFIADTIDQVAGNLEMRNRITKSEPIDRLILFHEECDLYVLSDDGWVFYSKFRASSLLKEQKDGWKMIHQHSSLPDSKAQAGENIAIEKISEENLQLREAIKRRTVELEQNYRELEIEAALERVRAHTMAMHQTSELQRVIHAVHEELLKLKLSISGGSFIAINSEIETEINCWGAGGTAETSDAVHIPRFEKPFYTNLLNGLRNGPGFFTEEFSQKEKIEFFTFLFQHEPWSGLSAEQQSETLSAPGGYTRSCAVSKHTSIFIINHFGKKFSEADNDILKRFGKVFEQTYTRFLDLQKAEAQAREAQINLAVERVRAKALAMFKSEEILQVVNTLKNEIISLEIPNVSAASIHLREPDGKYRIWDLTTVEDSDNGIDISLDVRYRMEDTHPDFFMREVWSKTDDYFVVIQDLTRTPHTIDWLRKNGHADYANEFAAFLEVSGLEKAYHPTVPLQKGRMSVDLLAEPTPEIEIILKKMAGAFDLAYKRFEDLQKAEAQAREAQIETALEKVRSRSLAMHKSDELGEVVSVLFEKLKDLQIPFTAVGIATGIADSKDLNAFVCGRNEAGLVITNYRLPYFNNPIPKDLYKALEKQSDFFVGHYSKEEKDAFYEYVIEHTAEFRHLPEDIKDMIFGSPTYTISMVAVKNAVFNVNDFEGKVLADPEIDILKRFARVFDQAYIRFLDIKKAEEQAREAQIEAALERVRSRSLAMHSSDEFVDASDVMVHQLKELGIDTLRVGIGIINKEDDSTEIWSKSEIGGKVKNTIIGIVPRGLHPVFDHTVDAWKSKKLFYANERVGIEVKEYYYKLDAFLSYPARKEFNERESMTAFFFSHGSLNVISLNPLKEGDCNIMIRFAKVFGQIYTRFLDLQKAEAQAREAQIEASLERVRARTMAMHSSDELLETGALLFKELSKLDVKIFNCGYVLMDDIAKVGWNYGVNPGDGSIRPLPTGIPQKGTKVLEAITASWENQEPFLIIDLDPQETIDHQTYIAENMLNFSLTKEQLLAITPERLVIYTFNFKHGYLLLVDGAKLEADRQEMALRFAKVFEQTYIRFLDLQKAEDQAREAQIEAALERVRSRTMAMQRSEQLGETASILFKQFDDLGIKVWSSGFQIWNDDNISTTAWMSSAGGEVQSTGIRLPHTEDPYFINIYNARNTPDHLFVMESKGKELEETYRYMFNIPEWKKAFGDIEDAGFPIPKYQITHCVYFTHGYLMLITHESYPEYWDIFKRFGKVFEQTYTRFLDLQKAEAQAKEATKQASLDRVRGVIASMRSAADLELITPLIFRELTILGVPFIRCGVFIIQEKEEIVEAYLSSPDGNSLGVLRLPFEASDLTFQTVEAWRKGLVYRQHWNKEDFVRWIRQLMEQDQIQDSNTYQGSAAPPESLDLHFVPFTQGMLYVGAVSPLSEDEIELVQSLANAFSIAFARYEDFVKLEQAKAEVESAMGELKATQSQLIQQEKLASLGQLTAGIAHEIKNPLNFINNFSEVNLELVDEIREERAKNQDARDETLVGELLDDIRSNLEKVHEHGARADRIVKSMLQHSRSGDNKKALKPLNPIIKEFVNLAYHGMRASKTPIEVAIYLQLSDKVGEVELIAEDFSRVVLNLCNNGFDAMREKLLKTEDGRRETEVLPTGQEGGRQKSEEKSGKYEPRLIVSTKLENGKVVITFEDNGPGIPDEIKDKILQPFFTTKKGTEGTGLGLSITHDIVKAHGGELEIQSKPGSTIFEIHLTL